MKTKEGVTLLPDTGRLSANQFSQTGQLFFCMICELRVVSTFLRWLEKLKKKKKSEIKISGSLIVFLGHSYTHSNVCNSKGFWAMAPEWSSYSRTERSAKPERLIMWPFIDISPVACNTGTLG